MAGEIKREEEKQVTKPGMALGQAVLGEGGPMQGDRGWGQLVFAHSFPWQADRQNLVQNTHPSTPPE